MGGSDRPYRGQGDRGGIGALQEVPREGGVPQPHLRLGRRDQEGHTGVDGGRYSDGVGAKSPVAGTRQRPRVTASAKAGFTAAVSALALMMTPLPP